MKYKIKISQEIEQEEGKYPKEIEIYTQTIQGDDKTILDIIKATNGLLK